MEFKIVENGKVLDVGSKGWKTEINKISWYDNVPLWDIRPWNENHTKCGKGCTLTEESLYNLYNYLKEIFE